MRFLSRFGASHPGIDLALTAATPERLGERLVAGDIDVALMAGPEGFPALLCAQPVYAGRFFVGCAPAHRFARRQRVGVADRAGEICLARADCE